MEDTVQEGIDLGKQAIAEAKAEKEVKSSKEPWEHQFEREHPDLIQKTAKKEEFKSKLDKAVEEQLEKPEEVIETKEDEQPAAESEAKPESHEEQPAEEDAKPEAKTSEAKKGSSLPEVDETYVKSYAERNNLSLDDAAEEINQNRKILDKYKNDPEELAKAYRNQQSEYDKSKTHQQQVQQNNVAQQIIADPKGFINNALSKNRDKLLTAFRTENPARSDLMTDDAILEELRDKGMANLQVEIANYQAKTQKDAMNKRDTLMSSLKEADKAFSQDIKAMLYKLPDHQVADPGFNFKDLVRWAKGNDTVITKMVKDAEERAYKRAMEDKRVLGDASVAKGTSSVKPRQKTVTVSGDKLNNFQKRRAVEMFGSAYPGSDEECYKAYEEVVINRKK